MAVRVTLKGNQETSAGGFHLQLSHFPFFSAFHVVKKYLALENNVLLYNVHFTPYFIHLHTEVVKELLQETEKRDLHFM